MIHTFKNSPVFTGRSIPSPSQDEIKNTPALLNASIEDASRYGGELTRCALSAMKLRGDRKYITVDTKVHMLMPGMSPAIPGWHTDGVPRGSDDSPLGPGLPNLKRQEEIGEAGPRYHLIVTGFTSVTKFALGDIKFEYEPGRDLYAQLTRQMKFGGFFSTQPALNELVEFTWEDIHTAVPAKDFEWRYLIRVTESDFIKPKTDLREVIRTQQQVYVPEEFGW